MNRQLVAVFLGIGGFFYGIGLCVMGAFNTPDPFFFVVVLSPWSLLPIHSLIAVFLTGVFWSFVAVLTVLPPFKPLFFSLVGLHYVGACYLATSNHVGWDQLLRDAERNPGLMGRWCVVYFGGQALLLVVMLLSTGRERARREVKED